MLFGVQTEQDQKLRWRIADRLDGREGPRAIWTAGGLVIILVLLVMLFRPYVGRPLRIGASGEVEQTQIECPAARTALTRAFNKADPSIPDRIRTCVETGRAKAFTAGLIVLLIGLVTWGASQLPQGRGRSRAGDGPSRWDRAIARAKSQAQSDGEARTERVKSDRDGR